jgi:hypothetical protein
MAQERCFLWEPASLSPDVWVQSPKQEEQHTQTNHAYTSFGDDGTTASVSVFGHILQISRFLGREAGASGLLCADASYLPSPYFVSSRMEDLMSFSKRPGRGFRIDFVSDWDLFESVPMLGYTHDRWPRYLYRNRIVEDNKSDPRVSARDAADIQLRPDLPRPIVTTTESPVRKLSAAPEHDDACFESTPAPLSIQYFCHNGSIIQNYLINLGVGGIPPDVVKWDNLQLLPDLTIRDLDFSTHRSFNDGVTDLEWFQLSDTTLLVAHSLPTDSEAEPGSHSGTKDLASARGAAAIIVSIFVNNASVIFQSKDKISLKIKDEKENVDITVVHKLCILTPDQMVDLRYLRQDFAQRQAEAPGMPPFDQRSEHVVPSFVFRFIQEARMATKEMALVLSDVSPFRRICFSPDPRLDFAFRRNLEHVLSVCAIPVDNEAVAITCGDISGHRVGPRASL